MDSAVAGSLWEHVHAKFQTFHSFNLLCTFVDRGLDIFKVTFGLGNCAYICALSYFYPRFMSFFIKLFTILNVSMEFGTLLYLSLKLIQLSTTDLLALASMKNAAKCDK